MAQPSGRPPWRLAVWAAIAAVAIATLVNGAASVRRQRYRDLTLGSERLIGLLTDIRSHVVDAETGQRGYLLTGADSYLTPYRAARGKVARDLTLLATAERVDELPAASVERLASLTRAKMGELEATVALRQAGSGAEALAIVRSNEGEALMDSLRVTIRGLLTAEQLRLEVRRTDEDRAADIVLIVLLGGAAVMLSALAYMLRMLNEYHATQRAARREMERQMEELEVLARERFAGPPAAG